MDEIDTKINSGIPDHIKSSGIPDHIRVASVPKTQAFPASY